MTRFSAEEILEVFTLQADYCAGLGSDFMAKALILVRDILRTGDTAFAKTILTWPGDPRTNADSVPLRVMGGLHALVLSGQDKALAAAYPPVAKGDLKAALEQTLTQHGDFLGQWIKTAPQTNETARQSPLVATACLLSNHFNMPLNLLELGASAGLNLRWDRVGVATSAGTFGNPDPALILTPDWQGTLPPQSNFQIASAKGVDINPLDPTNPDHALRLLAFLWPDQPDRLSRVRKAIDLATAQPITVAKGDAIDWLEQQLPDRAAQGVTLIYHTVAWQYFPTAQQSKGRALIEACGAKASAKASLAWLSMEADNLSPGAGLTLRLWPGDIHVPLGRADFHGRWVRWDAPSSLQGA